MILDRIALMTMKPGLFKVNHQLWQVSLFAALYASMLCSCSSDIPSDNSDQQSLPTNIIAESQTQSTLADTDTNEIRTLNRGNGEEPDTLDPHLSEGVPAGNIIRDLFEGLTVETPAGEIVPGAASNWDVSRDGKTYTFYLRPTARWSNGDPLLASDFVYSLQRSTDPATGSKYGHILAPIRNAQAILAGELPPNELGISALSERTVQIELSDPTPYFLTLLAHSSTFPVHPASVEQWGNAHIRPGNLVSNGAYQLTQWQVQSHIELIKNPYYWDTDNTRIERVMYFPIIDRNAELNRFRANELDWTFEVPNSQFDWLQENYKASLLIEPWLGIYYLGYNLNNAPFNDNPALRKALSLAIDRTLLTQKVTRFGEIPSFNLVPAGMPDYEHAMVEADQWTQTERVAEARQWYEQAGYSKNNSLEIELRYNTNQNHKKIALAVAAMWKETLGINTTLINEEWKVFLQNRSQARITEIFRAGWIGDYSDAFTFLEIFESNHGQNHVRYINQSYDRLLQQIRAERIPSRRARLMREAERMLLADQPIIPLYSYVTKRLINPELKGWQGNIMDHHYSKNLYFEESDL